MIRLVKASKQASRQATINVLIHSISPSYVQDDRQKNKTGGVLLLSKKQKEKPKGFFFTSRARRNGLMMRLLERGRKNTHARLENHNATAKASKETK